MSALELNLNGALVRLDSPHDTPLLWVLRDDLGLTATKFGCGRALFGACTVHVDGEPTRACSTPIGTLVGKHITTLEGLSVDGSHPVQQAWLAENVPQCGYCQSGQIMAAVALLRKNRTPSDTDIDAAMSGNICRCGTYPRIRSAIKRAAQELRAAADATPALAVTPEGSAP